MKKKITMKQIFIPVAIVVVLLAIVAAVLSNTGDTSELGYHTHENGEIHYDDPTTTQEYHVHEDGVTHYGEH